MVLPLPTLYELAGFWDENVSLSNSIYISIFFYRIEKLYKVYIRWKWDNIYNKLL